MCGLFGQRELTGERDLNHVTYLEISVNSQTSSLGNFGQCCWLYTSTGVC